jgi:arylsulfatase A-like enzyme
MVGKWHLGYSSLEYTPTYRGFDHFYGYYNGFIDYWNKTYGDYLDLRNGTTIETDPEILSPHLHNGYVLQSKAEEMIRMHMESGTSKPMFLYYAMQLVHGEWAAPSRFLERCSYPVLDDDYEGSVEHTYCAMNVMLDEAIANLTCVLEAYGMSDNTLLMIVSDNGAASEIRGASYPFMGMKGAYFRGGVSVTAIIHSKLIPKSMRGESYYGEMHVTDWLPTIMHAATNGAWSGSYSGMELDGHDMFEVIFNNSSSPRKEIVYSIDGENAVYAIQVNGMKLIANVKDNSRVSPNFVFENDEYPELNQLLCDNPSLMKNNNNDVVSAKSSLFAEYSKYGASDEDRKNPRLHIISLSLQRTWIFGVLSVIFISSMGFVILNHRQASYTSKTMFT